MGWLMAVTTDLKNLRHRAGLSMREMAEALGLKGPSGYQRYEDEATFQKPALPLGMREALHSLLRGRGSPPIRYEEIERLFGLDREPGPQPERPIMTAVTPSGIATAAEFVLKIPGFLEKGEDPAMIAKAFLWVLGIDTMDDLRRRALVATRTRRILPDQ